MISHEQCLEKLHTIGELRAKKTELKEELKTLEKEMGELNKEATEYFEMNDMDKISIANLGTFYVNREVYPNVDDLVQCKNWLIDKGDLEMLLTFNKSKFKAYYKERLENDQALPPGVTNFVKTEIRMRKA